MTSGTIAAIERWLVERGVPHLVEPREGSTVRGAFTRALPLLVAAYLLLGLNALDLDEWSLAENVAAATGVVVILLAAWVVSNRLRGVTRIARALRIDHAGFDVAMVGRRPYVLEFNRLFGNAGLREQGIRPGELVHRYLLTRTPRNPRKPRAA